MNKNKNNDVHCGKTACGPDLLRQYETLYDKLVEEGKRLLQKMTSKAFGYDQLRRMGYCPAGSPHYIVYTPTQKRLNIVSGQRTYISASVKNPVSAILAARYSILIMNNIQDTLLNSNTFIRARQKPYYNIIDKLLPIMYNIGMIQRRLTAVKRNGGHFI